MMLSFHYMELLRHETKGHYIMSSGIECYNKSGVEISVFVSMDRRNACIIMRYFGKFLFSEVSVGG